MKVKACIFTDAGKKRSVNQDSSLIKVANSKELGRISFIAVCDGMGGLSKGEVASCKVIRSLENWFHEELTMMQDLDESKIWEVAELSLSRLVARVSGEIRRYGKHRGISLGTTMTALLQIGNRYLLMNVGDSRIYFLNKRSITQVTSDQSVGNALTQCIGASSVPRPEILSGTIDRNTTVLACSDGFWRTLKSTEIFSSLCPQMCVTPEDMLDQCRGLCKLAFERHELDNITVAAMCLEY